MTTPLPEWLNADLFVSVLQKNVKEFVSIKTFSAKIAFGAGENYLSVLWSIEIEIALEDDSSKTVKFLLKVPPTSPKALGIVNSIGSFKREALAYYELLPAFEEMYRKAGKIIQIAPRAFQIDKNLGFEVILMHDARTEGYKNINRLEGMDMEHTKCALRKLAEFHAASAAYIVEKNGLPELLMKPMLTEAMVDMLRKTQEPQDKMILDSLPLYKAEHMKEKILRYQTKYIPQIMAAEKRDLQAFNVFGHGDCWSNNIMFQYDEAENILSTLFVDFQVSRLTSPAVDLTYLLLSSTCLENKIKYFDYFVKYYHDNLVENLKILNYPRLMPTLRDIQKCLYEYCHTAYTVILKSLPVVLLDPSSVQDISMDNMMGDKKDGGAMQRAMYNNDRYSRHMQQILPWMENRGYFD